MFFVVFEKTRMSDNLLQRTFSVGTMRMKMKAPRWMEEIFQRLTVRFPEGRTYRPNPGN